MKERLDNLLVERRLADTRAKAKIMIMEGHVFVNNQREDKAGSMFKPDVQIEVRGVAMKYVSRGGYKLEKAIEIWPIDLNGKVCMDIGSSTGGFTDCMLQNGASKVFAIDVGTNQLAWKLRQDSRVVSMEKTNIRYVTPEDLGEEIDFASVDVAFISITKFIGTAKLLLKKGAEMVCLVKPQFEAGREQVGKKGVVREKSVHEEVCNNIIEFFENEGFEILDLSFSPIKGPEGNIEYLLHVRYLGEDADSERVSEENKYSELVKKIVSEAHETL
ncbi:MAG: TlyA family RNA methyltransferase [Lachnospiraceae bacterium]|nr:TlyA family RNA methyltransferase [Lachnospiraceae bacterium]